MSNDHLVSTTYLKWFQANTSGKSYCSFCKLVKSKLQWTIPKLKHPNQICYEKERFYRQTEEEFNNLFEGKWNKLMEHLQQFNFSKLEKQHYKKNHILNSEHVHLILNFIFIHYKRTKQMRDKNRRDPIVLENLRGYEQKYGKKISIEDIDAFHKEVDNIFVTAPQESTTILKKRPWLLCVNRTQTSFITSSSPVLWIDERIQNGIYSPLSPQLAIFISLSKQKQKTGIVVEYINEDNVKKFNELLKKNDDDSILISNKKNVLMELIKKIG